MSSQPNLLEHPDKELLERSFVHCEYVAKTEARNFYYSFLTLPPEKKAAMCAIYAFMRYSDDVSDNDAVQRSRIEAMEEWKNALTRALQGDYGSSLILPAFHATVLRYSIPHHFFYELIEGTGMDMKFSRYATWEDLRLYCYRVASVVGFVCIHIWGFQPDNGRAMQLADSCGLALQLTNILRDVQEDIQRDRIYLPQEDMQSFGVSEQMLREGKMTPALLKLIEFETSRAEAFYQQAWQLLPLIDPDGQPTLQIMIQIYHGILEAIVKQKHDVFCKRARVSTFRKLMIVLQAWLKSKTLRS